MTESILTTEVPDPQNKNDSEGWSGRLIHRPDRLSREEEGSIISDDKLVGAVTANEILEPASQQNDTHQDVRPASTESFRSQLTRSLNEWIASNPGRVFYTVNGCYDNPNDYFLHILTIRGVNKKPVSEEEVGAELAAVKASNQKNAEGLRELSQSINHFLSIHNLPTLDMSLGHVHFVTDAQAASEFRLTPTIDRAAKVDGQPDVLITESAVAEPDLLRVSIVHEAMHVARDAAGLFRLADSKLIEEGFNHEVTKAMLRDHEMNAELDLAKQIYHIETWVIRKLCARLQLDPMTCSHDTLRQKLQQQFYQADEYNHPYQDLEDDISDLVRLWNLAEDEAMSMVESGETVTPELETILLTTYNKKLAEVSSRWQLESAAAATPPPQVEQNAQG